MTGSLVRFLTVDIFGFLFVNTLLCSFSKGEYLYKYIQINTNLN